ncbi:MAG TPA: hypothetical protein VL286_07250 [Rhizomicrobium sp.]|jgi:hypothetical protein|nr:hypothetical protein [Rhizomicrobium sp.]
MKPDVDQILNQSAGQLLGTIAPLLPTGYAQGTTSLLAFMMLMSAQEYERAADIRAIENAEIRALFAELGSLADSGLRARLSEAAATKDNSLRISTLNAANDELRRLLIVLQAHLEERPGAGARDAERRIWQVLKATAQRRLVRLPAG